MTPAGTSNELDVQNEWEENARTHLKTKTVRATETTALENKNHFSIVKSTILSRFYNQLHNIPRCLQYRLTKPCKCSFRQSKESVLPFYHIKYNRSGKDARRRACFWRSGKSHKHQRPNGTIWTIQPKRTPLVEILRIHIGKQYAHMLADNTRITCPCFSKQFKCVENSHFCSTDFSVKFAPVAKLIQYYL